MIYQDDCLNVLKLMPDTSIDMIYLDPPFYTQKKQALLDSSGKKYEFSDVWDSRQEYLEYMRVRLLEMRRVLKDTGNIFLHCDTSAGHYLRILLDEVFGESNFRSEIIWSYKRWSNSKRGLLPNHQTIYYYSKSKRYKFNTLYGAYSPTTNIDQILQERKRNVAGKAVYKRDEKGDVVAAKEKKGVPLSDVWYIPFLNPKAKERTGYPTQKPIELLEKIIAISTDKGDTVLDPFCGSGTTLVSAKLQGRKFIGIDINSEAVSLTKERLESPSKTSSILMKVGVDAYKTKTEDELSILGQFDCDIVQRNKGIDAFLKKYYLGHPVAIKLQKENESLSEAIQLLKNAAQKKKCSFSVLITNASEQLKETNDTPSNMIVLQRYQTQLMAQLNERVAASSNISFGE